MEKAGLKYTDLSDAYLVQLALSGDEKAYGHLFNRYNAGVMRHVAKYISDKADIEDLAMVTFSKAFSSLASYDTTFKFSTWIFRIARNTAFDYNEKTKSAREKVSPMAPAQESIPAVLENPEESVILQEDVARYIECISTLKEEYRRVAELFFVSHYAYQEIADELGLPLNTVKTRVRRAKLQLLKIIDTENA